MLFNNGLCEDIQCHVWPYYFLCLQITNSDIMPQVKWAVSLVLADTYFNISQEFVWVRLWCVTIWVHYGSQNLSLFKNEHEYKKSSLWHEYIMALKNTGVHTQILTLTLKLLVWLGGSLNSYCTIKPLCLGMVEVEPARTSPTLLPPSPRTVLSLSCFKVLQCINCRDWHCKS